jgi:hypothetical protein
MPGDDGPSDFIDRVKADDAKRAADQRAIAPAQRPRSATNGGGLARWLDQAFHGVIEDVRNTPEGNRNGRLRWGARRLAEISHGGLEEARCKLELERAAQDSGIWAEDGARQCRASIKSGWDKGISEPKDLSDIGTETVTKHDNGKHHDDNKRNGSTPEFGERTVKLRRLSTVRTVVPAWVWEWGGIGRIQLGTLSIFAGKPAAGKSTAVRWFAARLSQGELPGVWQHHPMRVAVLMSEEQTDAIVVPGLKAAGAEMDNVYEPQFKYGDVESSMISVSDETRLTEELVNEEVRALFIDPVMATFSGKTDIYRSNEVRQYLDPFKRIAAAINGIVVGVTHLRKGDVSDVLGGINGSSAFGEVPRSVFGFAPTEGGEHVLEQVKNSAGPMGLKLCYQLAISHLVADDGQEIQLPRFEILGETEVSISDIDAGSNETTGIAVACQWLRDYLEVEQPAPSRQVKNDAKLHGDIGERMIIRAMRRLNVQISTRSEPGKPHVTVWCLPEY